ncbi:hypothetical protein AXG93_2079s1000 [Marchantia polymorpha subsp. ruderalis]|uniref:Uncharacterized protein n=1 Tax=Marchantia polymorpha subsp. ruderalis TaxID=1480154 RepID=A0A176VTI0_MARPO|nr:hypothetical protein AXG93_2079s1000 [Marchantia polymorpha subsp. ruderalis]
MKVPYKELRPFRCELSELQLEFLFWNWNCVSASICKEIIDKNRTKGVELRGNERVEDNGLHRSEDKGYSVGNYAHLATNAYDVCDGMAGMRLLTREEEKQLPKEREILMAESSEGTEDDTRQPSIPAQTTARGPVQVEVVRRREKPERRVAKRRRVVSDDEGDLTLEVRRTETEVDVIRQSRTHARSKMRANQALVAVEELDSSVEKTVAPIDSVVLLLKYLDGKREKYAVSKEVGFYVEMIRNRTQLKRAVKRKWDSATELARERTANLATECAAVKVTLQEREAQLREK